jgi:hypothetical protein
MERDKTSEEEAVGYGWLLEERAKSNGLSEASETGPWAMHTFSLRLRRDGQ